MAELRQIWKFSVILEATAEDADKAREAVTRALCPDDDHAEPCAVPWALMSCRFEDLDEDERAMWQQEFDADRRQYEASTTD